MPAGIFKNIDVLPGQDPVDPMSRPAELYAPSETLAASSGSVLPAVPVAAGTDWVTPAAGAAAATTKMIAGAVQQQQGQEFQAGQSAQDRALQAQLARMRLTEAAREFNANRELNSYQTLMNAYNSAATGSLNSAELTRRGSNQMTDLLAETMLRRKHPVGRG